MSKSNHFSSIIKDKIKGTFWKEKSRILNFFKKKRKNLIGEFYF
jgi:hypothetical protein